MAEAAIGGATIIHDLLHLILSSILASVIDTKARNAAVLAVTHLDLSLLSPWGHSFVSPSSDPTLLAHLLRHAFPMVTSLTVYARTLATLQLLAPQWPNLTHNSHFAHQTAAAGDGACHSSSSPPSSSSRSPSSGGDGGETSRSSNPHLHSFISS
ncbi:hypothetical protein AAG906_007380 [Vitis piasezkii]